MTLTTYRTFAKKLGLFCVSMGMLCFMGSAPASANMGSAPSNADWTTRLGEGSGVDVPVNSAVEVGEKGQTEQQTEQMDFSQIQVDPTDKADMLNKGDLVGYQAYTPPMQTIAAIPASPDEDGEAPTI